MKHCRIPQVSLKNRTASTSLRPVCFFDMSVEFFDGIVGRIELPHEKRSLEREIRDDAYSGSIGTVLACDIASCYNRGFLRFKR
jgi:hypothetical protein